MKLTKSQYIEENIKLSIKNTNIMLKSIENNLNSIKDLTHQIQNSTDRTESMLCIAKIREIAIESVVEKTNIFKAGLDRFVIPYEDTVVPKMVKYIRLRNPSEPLEPTMASNKRFRDKISKTNIPNNLCAPIIIEDDDGGDGSYD
jgi:hypothetical protein